MLDELNDSELWELARTTLSSAWSRPIRLKRWVSRERVIELIESSAIPRPEEEYIYISGRESDTRTKLQVWVEKNWNMVNSQLPCVGPLRGKCTRYPCPDGRHYNCFAAASPHML